MKKIFPFLCFSVFFCSCPMEDVTWDEGLDIRIQNKTSQVICANIKYDVDKRKDYTVKKDSIMINSTEHLCGIGFDESIKDNAFPILKERVCNKSLLIKNLDDDTLANWTDSSFIFCDNQYWLIEPDENNNEVHCTLQLTDEVLQLK